MQLLREETTKVALREQVDAFVEAKSQELAELVEQSKEAFDELERQVNERNAKEFDAALVRPCRLCTPV